MRGLKPKEENISGENLLVASFTDAWIETFGKGYKQQYQTVASFTDAWIETSHFLFLLVQAESHLLQMRGLKHFYWFRVRASIGRIFYRCVD